jgi:uncharacterized protein YdaU (DUF1376 family)
MAKDPTFPFYAQDFLIDTLRWSRDMQGLHVCLLAESWANGGLPNENEHPLGLGSTDVQLWFKIKHKWYTKDGHWFNYKLEEVRAARETFREKQREKGILSGKKRKSGSTKVQPKANSGSTTVEPIESESEYEIENRLKGAFDEIYMNAQSGKWPHLDFMFEFRTFCEKVRGSLAHYRSHDTSGLRLAFQSQLRNSKGKNGITKNKRESPADLAAAFAERVSRNAASGEL